MESHMNLKVKLTWNTLYQKISLHVCNYEYFFKSLSALLSILIREPLSLSLISIFFFMSSLFPIYTFLLVPVYKFMLHCISRFLFYTFTSCSLFLTLSVCLSLCLCLCLCLSLSLSLSQSVSHTLSHSLTFFLALFSVL